MNSSLEAGKSIEFKPPSGYSVTSLVRQLDLRLPGIFSGALTLAADPDKPNVQRQVRAISWRDGRNGIQVRTETRYDHDTTVERIIFLASPQHRGFPTKDEVEILREVRSDRMGNTLAPNPLPVQTSGINFNELFVEVIDQLNHIEDENSVVKLGISYLRKLMRKAVAHVDGFFLGKNNEAKE